MYSYLQYNLGYPIYPSEFHLAVVSTLLNFVRMFKKAHEENIRQLGLEMKKTAGGEKLNSPIRTVKL